MRASMTMRPAVLEMTAMKTRFNLFFFGNKKFSDINFTLTLFILYIKHIYDLLAVFMEWYFKCFLSVKYNFLTLRISSFAILYN